MLSAGLLISSLWVNLQGQAVDPEADTPVALVCQASALAPCLTLLPPQVYASLPNAERLQASLGRRGAMAVPIQSGTLAGLVLMAPEQLPDQIQTIVGGLSHRLELPRQQQLTLWHELGHLHISSLPGSAAYSAWQHEALADLYLLWVSAQNEGDLQGGWQQYHRRNLQLLNDIEHLSHWSVPVLFTALQTFSLQQLLAMSDFNELIAQLSLLPGGSGWPKPDKLNEFASLTKRLFGTGSMQALPGYLYWIRGTLGDMLKPSLRELMGEKGAAQLMKEHALGAENAASVGTQGNAM
ncbi:MAG: hypothetical protein LPD71_15380 [Shewanella sp.]|nr:hypothetical protein [Shewanella sp.]MCF1431600.1 hypothetical protein [Shewanella sp.]MCF1440056.1 hypothetical protein [Shewanella sp.]MCF1457904.1 hypothetical protein [Shewanella sp.]